MPFIALIGVVVTTLVGAATLAFRVVRTPSGGKKAIPPQAPTTATTAITKMDYLVNWVTFERNRHEKALVTANADRRAERNLQARNHMLDEIERQANKALRLFVYLHPEPAPKQSGWLFKTKAPESAQAKFKAEVDKIKVEIDALRFAPYKPDKQPQNPLHRVVVFVTGGARDGRATELAQYHRDQLAYFRQAVKDANEAAKSGQVDEAMLRLNAVFSEHKRAINVLREHFGLAPAFLSETMRAAAMTRPLSDLGQPKQGATPPDSNTPSA